MTRASSDAASFEQSLVRIDAEACTGRKREVAVEPLDQRRTGERGDDMGGRNQPRSEIGGVRDDRDAGLVGQRIDVAHDRDAAYLGHARLEIIGRAALDQAREIHWAEHGLADRDGYAGPAELVERA